LSKYSARKQALAKDNNNRSRARIELPLKKNTATLCKTMGCS
ncbi:unnamed protein product, partial [marine sediment metagenome]